MPAATPAATAPPGAPAPAPITALVASAPPLANAGAAPETFATVTKRGARRLIPPPIAKPKQPFTCEQYDAKARQSQVRDAIAGTAEAACGGP
ncbi:hypothetical protein HDU83_008490, partial [Entophlyctis luteolus]